MFGPVFSSAGEEKTGHKTTDHKLKLRMCSAAPPTLNPPPPTPFKKKNVGFVLTCSGSTLLQKIQHTDSRYTA